jgi:hypothetical protein
MLMMGLPPYLNEDLIACHQARLREMGQKTFQAPPARRRHIAGVGRLLISLGTRLETWAEQRQPVPPALAPSRTTRS